MANEHLTFEINTSGTYPAWSAPDKSIPVTSASFTATRVHNRFEDTGATIRSRKYASQGAVQGGTGQVNFRGYPVHLLPWLFRSFLTDAAKADAGTGWDNDLLPQDSSNVQLPWFSFQQKYNASVGVNARGCVLNTLTLACAGGEELNVQAGFVVADTARTGQNWSDGSTSSAALVSPIYPSTLPAPLRFHEAALKTGVTVAQSTNKLTNSSGSTIATFQNMNLEFALNVEGRFALRDGHPTIAFTRHGERNITFTGDIDWASYGTTYYDAMKAATETTLVITFISDDEISSGQPYELIITLPRVVYPEDGGAFPDVDGSHMPKTQAVRLVAMEDATYGDVGVSIQTSDDLVS